MGALTLRYIAQMVAGTIQPTLASWLTFTTGVAISFVSYIVESDSNIVAGILNTVDLGVTMSVTVTVAIYADRSLTFTRFERGYLIAAGVIVLYGVAFSDAWRSNIFSNALITAGYIPLFARFLREQRNTESFTAWGLGLAASLSSMAPAILSGNALAILYSSRSALSCAVCLLVMTYFHTVHARLVRVGH